MNIKSIMRRKARIVADVLDRNIPASTNNDLGHIPTPGIDLPPAYIVEVQVKTWVRWICIWREICDFSDGDTREHINRRAHHVYDTITEA